MLSPVSLFGTACLKMLADSFTGESSPTGDTTTTTTTKITRKDNVTVRSTTFTGDHSHNTVSCSSLPCNADFRVLSSAIVARMRLNTEIRNLKKH
ncbi:hypothetical protein PoB_004329200 [Plakobranchus ocellatus]|uniref:Secreted protein n=1 Tax=Plakobranchus ocellatus TaxID=259542 RepID=A0AAV4BCV1_9GAST|nr:hypothetical protein PoB_004329200 [Plakobranchus ocellatus]